ncbi:hypothetical protein ES702_01156 [subsurface metagenome]
MKNKEIKSTVLIFILFFPLVIGCPELKAYPFQMGETLIYTVKFLGISVGEQTLEVKDIVKIDGHFAYYLFWRVKTLGWTDLLFPLDERRESFIDINTLYPHKITIYHEERGNLLKDWIIEIDQESGVALIRNKENEQKKTRLLSSPAFDIPSLIYWLRSQEMEVGKIFSLFLLEDSHLETYDEKIGRKVRVKVVKKEEVRIHNLTYLTFLCSEVDSDKIKVWFSVDEGHLPIKIEIGTDLGALTAYLTKIEYSQ